MHRSAFATAQSNQGPKCPLTELFGPLHAKTCPLAYADSEGPDQPAVAQSDARPTGDQEFAGSITDGSGNILYWTLISTAILSLPLIQERQLSVSGERMCTNTG